jgi:hypothetical protein
LIKYFIKTSILLAALMLGSVAARAQATPSHEVDLTWTASTDGGTVTVYRASGLCSATTLSFVKLTSTAPAGGPYKDTAVTAGNYCYYVTATVNGTESVPSNSVNPSVPTAPPTNLVNVVVK